MPRTYARIDVTRYFDEGWRALTAEEQAVYEMLVTHPKLTLCGALDVKLPAWAATFKGMVEDHLVGLLDRLVLLNMIGWDKATGEVVIRTFVRHDGVLQNKNSGKGMWSAWATIESQDLRIFLVDNLPEPAFGERFDPPISALKIHRRDTGSIDRCERSIHPSIALAVAVSGDSEATVSDRFTPSFMKSNCAGTGAS